MNAETDFAVAREAIDKLDGWVQRLASPLLPAERVGSGVNLRWKFKEETPRAVLVAKAVRMASGIRAAMILADAGFGTEAACLLRIIGDLAVEVVAIAEGELRGEQTKAQEDFVGQFFSRPPVKSVLSSPALKKDFVSRDELVKAHVRLAQASGKGKDKEEFRENIRTVAWGYDGYVHGSYSSAMELYHPGRHEFMVRGHEGERQRRVYQTAVSSKVVEVVNAFWIVAMVEGNQALSAELGGAARHLIDSREQVLPARASRSS